MASSKMYKYVVNFKSTCGDIPLMDVVPSEVLQKGLSNLFTDRNISIVEKITTFAILRMGGLSYADNFENDEGIFYMPSTKEVLSSKNLRVIKHTLKRGYVDYYQWNSDGDIETVRIYKSGRVVINPFRDKNRPFRVTSEGEMLYPRE